MTAINNDFIFTLLRTTGAQLLLEFQRLRPTSQWDETLTLFHAIDGPAAEHIRQCLAARYPTIGWLGEIEDPQRLILPAQGEFWICDAIDGAVQYLRGIPQWAISLTLLRDGQPVMAVVYDVIHQELFHAERGKGAFLNQQPITVNASQHHRQGLVAHSHPPLVSQQPQAIVQTSRALGLLLEEVMALRNLGPTALQICYVACGRIDAFWQFGFDGFNCIGAALIVVESGGWVTDMRGSDYALGSDSLLAAPRAVNQSIRARLASPHG